MISGSLPRRYARALIQTASEEAGGNQVEKFGRDLSGIASALEANEGSRRLLDVLADETIAANQRLAAVAEIADRSGCPVLLKNVLCLLVKKKRISLLPEIDREYRRFEDEILGIVRVTVTTPGQADADLLQRVEGILSRRLGKKVISKGEVDPGMIGGMILKVDHTVYDGSIRRELQKLKTLILNG